ncbi:MAG: GerW family sporulation protein [Eubacteriales bacterium]|nr:GerW family sporulation protein [Eubacteriales bacterium]
MENNTEKEKVEKIDLKETNIQKTFTTMLEGFKTFAKTNSVVGEPIYAGDSIIIPIMELSCGMGVGDFSSEKENFQKSAGAINAKLTPTSLLIIQEGKTRLMSIKNQDFISKTLDMVPDFVDKLLGKHKISQRAEKDAIRVKESLENN